MIDLQQPMSMYGHMLRGSIWMLAMRWGIRGIGLISTVILARLLTPEDFGIVAMAMIVVGFIELFGAMGVDLALIRNPTATRAHYDSAWTLEIFQGAALAMAVILVAPFASAYFDEPRLSPVMQVLALRALVGGFENVGVVAFRKDFDFAKDFQFGVYKKLLSFALTVIFAFVLRNYWAGGRGLDAISYGLLHEEFGRACSSTRTLLTVHDMVAEVILKMGGEALREAWLPALTAGKHLAAFALTEPEAGSDAAAIQTTASPSGDGYLLTGRKKWISFGQVADLFLVIARIGEDGSPGSFLVERETPGLTITPMKGLLGLRGSMLRRRTVAAHRRSQVT